MANAAPPIRAITRGPKFHWFGYYDKLEFDPAGRYVLGMEVDFEGRSPRPDDVIKVGMVDTHPGDRWTELGESRAWCWQQGCMLQWRPRRGLAGVDPSEAGPAPPSEVLWNDRRGDRFVCHILDVQSGKRRTLDHPIYTVSPDGRMAVAPDFSRIQDCRPGYGYAGVPDGHAADLAPEKSGIFRLDIESGKQDLVLALAEVVRLGGGQVGGVKHWVNHLLFNTDGTRFVFLHRCRREGRMVTRMITAAPDGRDLVLLDASGETSHFIWRDREHILAWTRPDGRAPGFYLFKDGAGLVEQVGGGVMTENGHCSYLPGQAKRGLAAAEPGGRWILNDTYPRREDRVQQLYLFEVATGRRVALGGFAAPKPYAGEWRCDLHPRASPDGRRVVIDSAHAGGRQLYLIEIGAVVG